MPIAANTKHVTGGCQAFTATDCKERFDSVRKILYQDMPRALKLIEDNQPLLLYTAALENNGIMIAVRSQFNQRFAL